MSNTLNMETVQPTTTDTVIRRIQKLLALASNPNEAEASAAMDKAQELLAKYNLDLAVVRDTAVAGGTVEVQEKREKTKVSRSAMYEWQRDLWKAIAVANFCYHWVSNEFANKYGRNGESVYVKRHTVLGRQSNVIAVQMMGEYLCDTIERLLPYPNTERLSRSAISWRKGCAERLVARIEALSEQLKESTMTASNGTELALRSVFEREQEANYDVLYGEGAWARAQARQVERQREWDEARAKAEADEAAGNAASQDAAVSELAAETPAQRARREKREEKERDVQRARNARYWDTYHRRRAREASKLDWSAYSAGKQAGDRISLSKQVGTKSEKPKEIEG